MCLTFHIMTFSKYLTRNFDLFLGGNHFLAPWSVVSPKMTTPKLPMTPFFYRRFLFLSKNGHTVAVVIASPKLRLLSKVVFRQRLSSVKGRLLSKVVVFLQRSYCVKGCLPSKLVFHQRSSSIKGRFPSMFVFHINSLQKWVKQL